jgi:hypothetical protein
MDKNYTSEICKVKLGRAFFDKKKLFLKKCSLHDAGRHYLV